ncbi:E3 ubiquitin-protein ligase RNF212B-like [Acropora palmata]|uniref:E3 ubiquitin-protein ligase RNF212B-like n=1 Tax=Acropora palmata TaxID=6131 RepID=UPI003DA030C6
MADWVHCNSCFVRPSGGKRFSLTNCGHIYCEECLRANPNHCAMCNRACNSIVLSSQMKQEVEMYFTDPADLSKKYHSQLSQVMEFQKSHRQRLAAANEKKVLAAEMLRQKMSRLQDFEREIAVLREENSYLKRLLASNSSKPGTPHNCRNSPGLIPMKRGRTPSPTSSQYSSASPYGRTPPNSSQKENKGLHQWQNQVLRTPAGPTRLSVRTPPCNGYMGTVKGTPSPNKPLSSRPSSAGGVSGSIIRNQLKGIHFTNTANTPGNYEATTPSGLGTAEGSYSPMHLGTPSNIRSNTPSNGRMSIRSQYTTPSSSQLSRQVSSTHHDVTQPSELCSQESHTVTPASSQLDPQRRQIQDGARGHATLKNKAKPVKMKQYRAKKI